MATTTAELYPCPSKASLLKVFVRKHLDEIPTPAAILDRAVVRKNCAKMLQACESLHLKFRAHVKTHKTVEIARLQVGESSSDARIVVSTLAEAEYMVASRNEWVDPKKTIEVLYGVPLPPSQAQRLGHIGKQCGLGGHGTVSLLIDHVDQLDSVQTIRDLAGYSINLFIKVDTGYHRAGVQPDTSELKTIVERIILALESSTIAKLSGFYSHAGHSYNTESRVGSLCLLQEEIEGLEYAATVANTIIRQRGLKGRRFTLSAGATPSATSIQDIQAAGGQDKNFADQVEEFLPYLERVQKVHEIELHAGVYPILDLQQVATRTENPDPGTKLFTSDIALTILVEVVSIYPGRSEALIAAGTLALGREPCKLCPGWGKVTRWNTTRVKSEENANWMIGRISQEHSILVQDKDAEDSAHLAVGQKVRIWPNHACIAGAGYGWYLVVDSSLPEYQQDTVQDVWLRCRGW